MSRQLAAMIVVSVGLLFFGSGRSSGSLLYVSAYDPGGGNGRIYQIDETGARTTFVSAVGLTTALDLVFDSSGNLYVADADNNVVREFSPTGADLGIFASAGLSTPTNLAFDTAGNLYVSTNDFANGVSSVHRFSPTGADLGVFASAGLSNINGLAFDASGNLYVALIGDAIRRFSPTGADLGIFASPHRPIGLVFDESGILYATASSTVLRFTPGGTNRGDFSPGLTDAKFLRFRPAVTAIPEPSTLTLLAIGLAGLGSMVARERRRGLRN